MNDSQSCARRRAPFARNAAVAHQAGFTLVEIMVVIVILGLLATMVVPNVFRMSEEAKVTKAQTDVKAIYDASLLFKMKNSKIPTVEELQTPDDKGQSFLDDNYETKDPWDQDYVIRETDRGRFEVLSMGPDRSEGTEDDISSRRKDK
ncbi:MAG: type II secretion system major pseudopilin GspG [Planctomycetota bacterium]